MRNLDMVVSRDELLLGGHAVSPGRERSVVCFHSFLDRIFVRYFQQHWCIGVGQIHQGSRYKASGIGRYHVSWWRLSFKWLLYAQCWRAIFHERCHHGSWNEVCSDLESLLAAQVLKLTC